MNLRNVLDGAGLSKGESRVYLALNELGPSTTGPIIRQSGVARSFIYQVLSNLVEKGLVSSIRKNKQRVFQACEPGKLLEFMDLQMQNLAAKRKIVKESIPSLEVRQKNAPRIEVTLYEGFAGVKTAFEHFKGRLRKGDEYISFGHPKQEIQYTLYWKRHHLEREALGVKARMLFDRDAPRSTMENRNSFPTCDTRFIPSGLKNKSWFFVYADTVTIFLQEGKDIAVEIVNQKIADTFRGIFEDYWSRSRKYKQS